MLKYVRRLLLYSHPFSQKQKKKIDIHEILKFRSSGTFHFSQKAPDSSQTTLIMGQDCLKDPQGFCESLATNEGGRTAKFTIEK